jgi:hypothetical protein
MARIPTPRLAGQEVGSVQIQGTPTPFQNLQTNADMFGASQARALQQASEGISAAADGLLKSAQDDDATNLVRTQNEGMSFSNDMINNPENGLLTRRGIDAVGATKEAVDKVDEWARSLPEPTTRSGKLAQQEYIAGLKARAYQTLSTHERAERRAQAEQDLNTSIGNVMQEAQTSYTNPAALQNNESMIRDRTKDAAAFQGLSGEAADELVETNVSKMYVGVLDRMIVNGESSQAIEAAFMDMKRRGVLQPGDEFNRIQKAISAKSDDEQALSIAMEVGAKYGDDGVAAAAEISKMEGVDAAVKNAATAIVDRTIARKASQEAAELRDLQAELSAAAAAGNRPDAAQLGRLPGNAQTAIMNIFLNSGTDQKTDRATWMEWSRLTSEEKGRLSEEDFINNYLSKFSNKDQDAANAAYATGREAVGRTEATVLTNQVNAVSAEVKSSRSYFEKQVADRVAQVVGTGSQKAAKRSALEAAFRVQFETLSRGGPLTPEAVDQFLIQGMIEYSEGGRLVQLEDPDVELKDLYPEGSNLLAFAEARPDIRADLAIAYVKWRSANDEDADPDDEVDADDFSEWWDEQYSNKTPTDLERQQIIEALGGAPSELAIDTVFRNTLLDGLLGIKSSGR